MKRCRFGAGLLILLLILGAASAWAMGTGSDPVVRLARQAEAAALEEDWAAALARVAEAEELWERHFAFWATLSDHEPMEQINGLFAQLAVYARCRDAVNFGAVCALIAETVEAMGEAHSLKWRNLL